MKLKLFEKGAYQRTWNGDQIRAMPEWQYVVAVAEWAGWPREIKAPLSTTVSGSYRPRPSSVHLWKNGPPMTYSEAVLFLEGFRYGRDLGDADPDIVPPKLHLTDGDAMGVDFSGSAT